ncbi:hypothetical protein CC2G_006747 [Coprinopsis cinerea AmutBmut pab1-1]|nr:hypothetical protein CC2G_006747 [Coprinopsis cinerea AmutBmut pab1-1]
MAKRLTEEEKARRDEEKKQKQAEKAAQAAKKKEEAAAKGKQGAGRGRRKQPKTPEIVPSDDEEGGLGEVVGVGSAGGTHPASTLDEQPCPARHPPWPPPWTSNPTTWAPTWTTLVHSALQTNPQDKLQTLPSEVPTAPGQLRTLQPELRSTAFQGFCSRTRQHATSKFLPLTSEGRRECSP